MEEKVPLKTKISTGLKKFVSHWKTPPEGYYVSYKEIFNLSCGFGGLNLIAILITWTTIAVTVPMMISYFKVSAGFVFVSGVIASLLGLLRAPILSLIIDNSNSKKGKFKPFMLLSSVLAVLCYTVIPFIPEAWTSDVMFGFHISAIPILGVAASYISVTKGTLWMFILSQVGAFFYNLLTQCITGMEQTISPITQERANVTSVRGIVAGLPSSLANIIIPAAAGIVFAETVSPMNNIELYRVAFPICGVIGIGLAMFAYFGCEERTVVHKEFKSKVKLLDGVKQLSKNKYFWITSIFNLVWNVRTSTNFYLWVCNYALEGSKGAFALSLCNIFLNNALVPGMLLGPLLIKKLGKRNVMLVSTIGFTAMEVLQLFCLNNPYMILVAIFCQNLFNGLSYINNVMVSDALDYQQYKTGQRLEGFFQNFFNFVYTFFAIFTSALLPLFMSFGGVGFEDNIDVAFKDAAILHDTFESVTWLGIICSVACIIPILFYDFSEKKHANYIRALEVRAAVLDYKNNELTSNEIVKVQDIYKFTQEESVEMLYPEFDSDEARAILAMTAEDTGPAEGEPQEA